MFGLGPVEMVVVLVEVLLALGIIILIVRMLKK